MRPYTREKFGRPESLHNVKWSGLDFSCRPVLQAEQFHYWLERSEMEQHGPRTSMHYRTEKLRMAHKAVDKAKRQSPKSS